MTMKRKIGLAMLLWTAIVHGQQRPHYTQYIMNNYILNPAITGIENYTDVKISVRNQWVGIEGAPKTFYITMHGPLGKKDHRENANSFSMIGENPRGKEYWTNYSAAEPHHGIGFTAVNYSTGYINRTTAYATYAYHVGLSARTSLAAGFGAGLTGFNIDRSKIQLATALDPAIGTSVSQLNKFKPEMNAGLWLYSADYFVGLSAQQLIPVNLELVDNSAAKSTQVPHIFTTAGYKFFITDDISGLPSVMTRFIASQPLGIDVNFKAQFRDLVWMGGSYRKGEGFAGMMGLNISQRLNISYSYDLNRSKYMLSSMHQGSHELVIGFLLNNDYDDWCPRHVW